MNEEKRVSAAAVDELSKLRECREDLERKLEEERRKFEEERKCLVQQGIEATSRLHHLESKASQRSYQVQTTETQSTEHKVVGFYETKTIIEKLILYFFRAKDLRKMNFVPVILCLDLQNIANRISELKRNNIHPLVINFTPRVYP